MMTWSGPENAAAVKVPDLVGLLVRAAREVAWDAGLVIASADPDGPPLAALTWPGTWVVTAQHPEPGSMMRYRGSVVVDFETRPPGGESGDREPLRPVPPPAMLRVARGPVGDGEFTGSAMGDL